MESYTGITADDILQERNEARVAGRLAHTPNVHGDFFARINCSCYTCRDVFDPTGEEDAQRRNCPTPPPPPPPPSPPVLRRQNALCYSCGVGHSCRDPCESPPPSLGPSESGPISLRLPPPPPATRAIHLSPTASNVISPVATLLTPRSISDPSSIEEAVQKQENSLVRRLTVMVETYQRLEDHILSQQLQSDHHDELMMYDMWWEEMDRKRAAVAELLRQLQQ